MLNSVTNSLGHVVSIPLIELYLYIAPYVFCSFIIFYLSYFCIKSHGKLYLKKIQPRMCIEGVQRGHGDISKR
jgi:hypothetical protein